MKSYYESGGITIYHGDCREILPQLKADVILTDPPYGTGENYASYDDTSENLDALIADVFPMMQAAAKRIVLTPGMRNVWRYPRADWMLCWVVPGGTKAVPWGFACWTPFLCYGRLGPRGNGQTDGKADALVINNCASDEKAHPCAKPLRVWQWALDKCGPGVVIDPFMGSGTTLRSDKDFGRTAIGIEIEEKYCEVAVKRLAQEVLLVHRSEG